MHSDYWDTGDIVIALTSVHKQFTEGKEYLIDYVSWEDEVMVIQDDSGNANGWHVSNFKYKGN